MGPSRLPLVRRLIAASAKFLSGDRTASIFPGAAGYATLLVAVLLAVTPTRARAEFAVCNQTLDVVNLSVGQQVDGIFQTDGWWTIGVNQCVDVIREELANRYIYIYATDAFGHAILNGSTEMCIERRRFTVRGIDACWQHGHIAARFYEVDTLLQPRWTFFLSGAAP